MQQFLELIGTAGGDETFGSLAARTARLGLVTLLVACGADGVTGPGGSLAIGPIGPFPSGVTGKLAVSTSVVVTTSTRAYTETKVHVIDVANRSDRVIFSGQDVYVEGMTWAPDGQRLVIQTARPHPSGPNGENLDIRQLQSLDLAGTLEGPLFDGVGPEVHPAYSATGQLGYFGGWWGELVGSGLFVDGQLVRPDFHWDSHSGLSWAPDGRSIVYSGQSSGLSILSLSGGQSSQLLAPEGSEVIAQPAFSPDGTRIAVMRFGGVRQSEEIWTVSGAGLAAIRLTTGFADEWPGWTPGGRYLAFARLSGSAPGVYLIGPNGGDVQRVVGGNGSGISAIAWSR